MIYPRNDLKSPQTVVLQTRTVSLWSMIISHPYSPAGQTCCGPGGAEKLGASSSMKRFIKAWTQVVGLLGSLGLQLLLILGNQLLPAVVKTPVS